MCTAKEKINAGFAKLLQNSSFEKITVMDICKEAQINRTTFYEYYNNKSELLCALQMEYFDKMYDSISEDYKNMLNGADKKAFFIKVISYHKEHKKEYAYLLENNCDGIFETNISMHLKRRVMGSNYSKKEEFEFIYHFIAHLAVISSWVLEGMTVPAEDLADIMARSMPNKN